MPGLGFDILLIFTLMVIAWLIFVGWAASMILRGIWRGLRWMLGLAARPGVYQVTAWRWCSRIRCGAKNPPQARFCRRCGMPLVAAVRSRQRAAA
jgi:zinc-ribbon domain